MGDLSQDVILITGASRGIGAASAKLLASKGAKLALTARSQDKLDALVSEIEAAGGRAMAIAADAADPKAITEVVAKSLSHYGKLTGLLNNAGMIDPIGPIDEVSLEDWAACIQLNVIGAFAAAQAVLKPFEQAGGGRLVNISSGAAHAPLEGWSAYCTSKAALAMVTRALHHEQSAKGLKVFGFSPGVVATDMQVKIRSTGIGPVSQLPEGNLQPVERPAAIIEWLFSGAADTHAGEEIKAADPEVLSAVGLGPWPPQ